jgi:hypothetical protein
VLSEVRIGLSLCHDSLKIVFACEPKEFLAILIDVVAIEQPLALPRNCRMQPKFAVGQRKIPKVFASTESPHLLLVVRFRVLIPEDIECVEPRLGASAQKITELRLAIRIEADDLAVEHASATPQVANQTFAETRKTLKCVSVARDEPHSIILRMEQCPEAVPLDLENPVGMRERSRSTTDRHGLEMWEWHWS